jgi:hypothetical protein
MPKGLGSDRWVAMGNVLKAASGHSVDVRVHVAACPHAQLHILLDGRESPRLPTIDIAGSDAMPSFQWTSDGQYHWLRCEVRDMEGKLLLLSNPIYINLETR